MLRPAPQPIGSNTCSAGASGFTWGRFSCTEGEVPKQADGTPCFCLRPENRPSVFAFFWRCDMLGGGVKRGNSVLIGSARTSSQAASTSFPLSANSKSVQHLELITSYTSISLSWALTAHINCAQYSCYVLIRWRHFMWRCTHLLFFG